MHIITGLGKLSLSASGLRRVTEYNICLSFLPSKEICKQNININLQWQGKQEEATTTKFLKVVSGNWISRADKAES